MESAVPPESKPPEPNITDIVVFDFDGTLTTEDTFVGFMKFYLGRLRWGLRMAKLTPTFLAYKLGRIDRHAVKDAVVDAAFRGEPRDRIESRARDYAEQVIPKLMRPEGEARFREHWEEMQSGGPQLIVCSASISPYLRAHFRHFEGVEIIACELDYDAGGVCTGSLQTYNVWGKNKVIALADRFGSERFQIVAGYGDTAGDVPFLNMAQLAFYRPFRGTRESMPTPLPIRGKG